MSALLPLRVILLAVTLSRGNAGSPWGPGPASRATALLAKMSLADKIGAVHGTTLGLVTSGYVGSVLANEKLGVPLLGLEDGPQGVADGVPFVTALPAAQTVAATFDVDLAYAYGVAQGSEQKAKGTAVLLGPGTNLARIPWGGRNFEYLGEDPLLAARIVESIVRGIQTCNISACIKHYLFNNQEDHRDSASANVPERAAHELYLRPFAAAVDVGVGSAMCSYNRINNTYSCENNATLTGYLKEFLGFRGFIMSDWSATHSTIPSALAGLDMEMPDSQYYGASLQAAVQNGRVPLARLDDMVTRIFTALYAVGFMDDPPTANTNLSSPATSAAHVALAGELARASITLLKNDGVLP